MKMRLIAIAAIALSPAVVLGQTRTHIKVSKDGTHSSTTQQSTGGDVYTAPAPAPAPAPAAEPAPAPAPAPADTATPPAASTTTTTDSTAAKTDSTQMGTGAVAPTPTHSMQTDSTMKTDSTMSTTTTPVDTVRVPRNSLNVSPVDSARIGIPSTRQTQQADSAKRAADSTTKTTPPPR